jgi:hypothetical protein
MFFRGMTYVGYYYGGNKKVNSLKGKEAYLMRGKKYFAMDFDRLLKDFSKLHWITYCKKFKPLLID